MAWLEAKRASQKKGRKLNGEQDYSRTILIMLLSIIFSIFYLLGSLSVLFNPSFIYFNMTSLHSESLSQSLFSIIPLPAPFHLLCLTHFFCFALLFSQYLSNHPWKQLVENLHNQTSILFSSKNIRDSPRLVIYLFL